MTLQVREMQLEEVGLVIDYFHSSSPEHLELLGVDPTRLPEPKRWRSFYANEYEKPIAKRTTLLLVWLASGETIGFSTADKLVFGEEAYMHLHIVDPTRRTRGSGVSLVMQSASNYFQSLRLKRLYCEPNAFNVAPNRTLQRAGFQYVKTHRTVPGPLNYHQAVTRWRLDRVAWERLSASDERVDE